MTHRDTADERNRRNNGPQRPEVRPYSQHAGPAAAHGGSRQNFPAAHVRRTVLLPRRIAYALQDRPHRRPLPAGAPATRGTPRNRNPNPPALCAFLSQAKRRRTNRTQAPRFLSVFRERVAQASYGPGSSGRFGTAGGAGTVPQRCRWRIRAQASQEKLHHALGRALVQPLARCRFRPLAC